MVASPEVDHGTVLSSPAAAAGHLARICFKTGPPRWLGTELEWIVHDAVDPARPVGASRLRAALGPHSPRTLDITSPAQPLRYGSSVTVEPGGQVEVSTATHTSVAALVAATKAEIAQLTALLGRAGLVLGAGGIDAHRSPRPMFETPRYRAMRRVFDRRGPAGRRMMYSTAGLQICLDVGEADQLADRWATAHAIGPPLLAAFATAGRHAGRPTGWVSARMAAWLAIDPARTRAVWTPEQDDTDPIASWTEYVLAAPLLCLRGGGSEWTTPDGVTFADWLAGALPQPPTIDDLDYHVSTLFPPVRPRGYLELRYLDAQPGESWSVPVAVVAALLSEPAITRAARSLVGAQAQRWIAAARHGLRDDGLAVTAADLFDLALTVLPRLGLPPALYDDIDRGVRRRREAAGRRRR